MSFRRITGHRSLIGLLARAVARDTLPSALLFVGPEGVGKRRVAVALAGVGARKQVFVAALAIVTAEGA